MAHHIMTVDEFRQAFQNLPPLPFSSAKDWTWNRHRLEIRKHALKDDPREFTKWSTINGTMFVGNVGYVVEEIHDLIKDDNVRWRRGITESDFGAPVRMINYPYTSGNLVRQAYQLMIFENEFEVKTETLQRIVEFGGGYGAMCALIRRLGFSGEYVIYDLPELCILQRYYLSNLGMNADILEVNGLDFKEIDKPVDLLIACYSLSEVDRELRNKFFDTISPDMFLIATQDAYGGYSLIDEFLDLARLHPEYICYFIANEYMDGFYHIIGKRIK